VDLLDALTISMLPVSRSRACAIFKEIRHRPDMNAIRAADAIVRVCRGAPGEGATGADGRTDALTVARRRAVAAIEAAGTRGIAAIPWTDPRFPALLNCISDPPPVLWTRGLSDALGRPAVAIVGSRAATPYAKDVAYRLGEELGTRGMVVASGLARGVDSAAHAGCLAAGGLTVAVLGSGLDRIYPAEHHTLAGMIADKGILISELGPGAAPRQEHFPLRNRIISGISLAVVVVEASEKSGSLITARCALEQGRDVMAVPGSVLSGRNRGSHSLLKDGAKVVESADDILDGLGWPTAAVSPESASKCLQKDSLLTRMEAGEVYRLDELMELTGVTGTRLLPRLMELELAGLVTNNGVGFSRRLVT
jgi:DNA processing protein